MAKRYYIIEENHDGEKISSTRLKIPKHNILLARLKLKWEFYKDKSDKWRWRSTSGNGKIVGAATESYYNKADCIHNDKLNGYLK